MRKAIIVLFFALLVSIASAAENESAEDSSLGNSGDLPVVGDFAETVNETQSGEFFDAKNVIDASVVSGTQEDISIIGQANVNSDTSQSGKKQVTASFGVYLNIVG